MRTLNRPMFRYGGPIKEGVMNGIREPKRNGGSMKAALVGNPMFPVGPDGRAQHNKAVQYIGSKVPFLANTYNKGLANLKKIPGYFSSKMNKTVPKVIKNKSGRIIGEGGEAIPTYLGRDPTVKLIGGTYKIVTDPRAKGYAKTGVQFATSPSALLAGATFTDALPGGDPLFGQRNLLGQKYDKETGIKTEGLFGRDLPAKAELAQIEADRIAKAERDEQARLEALFKTQNTDIDTTPKKSDNELRQERIQKYRDIMDIKGMNKDAAYNSLIAASQAISGEGDFKGSLKDGSLINKIIGSTSKAFDKPKATKDAIDTLILKGEIEGDIAAGKPSTYLKTAQDMVATGASKNIQEAMKKLTKSENSMSETLGALLAKNTRLDENTVGVAYREETGNIPSGTTKLSVVNEWKGENEGKNEIDYVKELIKKGAELTAGDYIIGERVVTINDSGVPSFFY